MRSLSNLEQANERNLVITFLSITYSLNNCNLSLSSYIFEDINGNFDCFSKIN